MSTVRVQLPFHLRTLARVGAEISLEVAEPVTQRAVLEALETAYPMLVGTVRDAKSGRRRPLLRFFVGTEDLSHEPPDAPLPPTLARGAEAFQIVGAVAGG